MNGSFRHAVSPLVVIVILDGWPSAQVNEAFAAGGLPELHDWVRARGRYLSEVMAPLPTLTHPSHTSLLTGTDPRVHRLPSNLWLEEATGGVVNLQGRHVLATGRLMNPAVPTAFDRYPGAVAVHGVITRGAARVRRPLTKAPDDLLRLTARAIRERPRGLYVTWLPRADGVAHHHGPESPEFAGEIALTSRALGDFLDDIARARPEEDTTIVLASDHGHRQTGVPIRGDELLRAFGWTERDADYLVNPHLRTGSQRRVGGPVLLSTGGSALQVYPGDAPAAVLESGIRRLLDGGLAELVVGEVEPGAPAVWSPSEARPLVAVGAEQLAAASAGPGRGGVGTLIDDDPRYPDLDGRYLRSHIPGRSPRLLVFAPEGHYFSDGWRLGYGFGAHHGSHGGPSRAETFGAAFVQLADAERQAALPERMQISELLPAAGIL